MQSNKININPSWFKIEQRVYFLIESQLMNGVILTAKQTTHLLKDSYLSSGWVYTIEDKDGKVFNGVQEARIKPIEVHPKAI